MPFSGLESPLASATGAAAPPASEDPGASAVTTRSGEERRRALPAASPATEPARSTGIKLQSTREDGPAVVLPSSTPRELLCERPTLRQEAAGAAGPETGGAACRRKGTVKP